MPRVASTVWSNWKARIGIIILGLFFLLVAIFAPLIAPVRRDARTASTARADASAAHWLGTTAAGEDVLQQLIWGSQISIFVGFVAGLLSTVDRGSRRPQLGLCARASAPT